MNRLVVLVVVLLAVTPYSQGAGAGRAFPIEGENYAIDVLQRINKNIEWDPTNYLVDLSGNWANCRYVGQEGLQPVREISPDGEAIVAVVDNVVGSATDVNAANAYVRRVFDRWSRRGVYTNQILDASRFGCSIRPGCSGKAVIACLFSGPGTFRNPYTPRPPNPRPPNPTGKQNALAFTPAQYVLAESITYKEWDRSHYLENLSGFETECSLVTAQSHSFAHAVQDASYRGMDIVGLYGAALNQGETEPAMVEILAQFKKIPNAAQVGCSLIPDCVIARQMFVVISCLYEEP